MSAHTQEPWFIDQYGHVYGWKEVDGTTKQSVLLVDNRHTEASFADKTLITAAPDLLAALKELLDREWQDDNGEETLERARYKARDAIAKAEGKS